MGLKRIILFTVSFITENNNDYDDYQREQTREFVFYSLHTAISVIAQRKIEGYSLDTYFDIPENNKRYFDVLILNANLINKKYDHNIGILYKEILNEEIIIFNPFIEAIGELKDSFGHKYLDCKDQNDLNFLKSDRKLRKLLF